MHYEFERYLVESYSSAGSCHFYLDEFRISAVYAFRYHMKISCGIKINNEVSLIFEQSVRLLIKEAFLMIYSGGIDRDIDRHGVAELVFLLIVQVIRFL